MTEVPVPRPTSDLPNIPGVDMGVVKQFLAETLEPEDGDQLKPEALTMLKQIKYVPARNWDMGSGLDFIEGMVPYVGRIMVEHPVTKNEVQQKYGKPAILGERIDEGKILAALSQIRPPGMQVVNGEVIVLDDLGPVGAELRAYAWPYIGLRNDTITTDVPANIKDELQQRLSQAGVEPWRAEVIELNPGAQTQRQATLCVFTGK